MESDVAEYDYTIYNAVRRTYYLYQQCWRYNYFTTIE